MSVDGGDDAAHGRNHEHPGEQELARDIGAYARDLKQLDTRERGDDGVDGEPSHAEKESQKGSRVRTPVAEDAPSEDDLRLATFRSRVAEKAQDHRAGQRTDEDREQAVPYAKPVIRRQQAGGEQAGVVDEGARPEKAQFSRVAVTLRIRNGVDPMRLDFEKRI